MSSPGLGPGPGKGGPPFRGSCFETGQSWVSIPQGKDDGGGKDTVPCCVSWVRGRGGSPLRGLLEPLWPFAGEGPTSQKEEAVTGQGALAVLSNPQPP